LQIDHFILVTYINSIFFMTTKRLWFHLDNFQASLAMFLSMAFLVYLPNQLATKLIASTFNIPTRFDFFRINFLIPDNSPLWTSESIITVYLAGPLISLAFGLYFKYLHFRHTKRPGKLKLFFLWGWVHGYLQFFGSIIVGTLVLDGLGFVIEWMYIPLIVKLILVLLSLLTLLRLGMVANMEFLRIAPNHSMLKKPFKLKFFAAVVPSIVGLVIFFIIKFPDNSIYSVLINLLVLLILAPIMVLKSHEARLFKEQDFASFSWGYWVFAFIVIAASYATIYFLD